MGVGVVAVLALLATWDVGARYILRPVQALMHATTRLAAGDLSVRIGLLNGCEEWLHLARTFDQMAASLERFTQQYALLRNASGDGIYGVDRRGTTIFVNLTAARLLGDDPAVLCGQSMHTTLHHTKADGTPFSWGECPVYQTLTTGVVQHIPHDVVWRKDGTPCAMEYVSGPVVRRRQHCRGRRDVP